MGDQYLVLVPLEVVSVCGECDAAACSCSVLGVLASPYCVVLFLPRENDISHTQVLYVDCHFLIGVIVAPAGTCVVEYWSHFAIASNLRICLCSSNTPLNIREGRLIYNTSPLTGNHF